MMKKKLFTLAMTAAMALTMALPSFAAEPGIMPANGNYRFATITDGQYLSVSETTAILSYGARTWTPQYYGGVTKLFLDGGVNQSDKVIAYNYGPVSVEDPWLENSRTEFDIKTIGDGYYRLHLPGKSKYISYYNGNVQTLDYNESYEFLKWQIK